MFVPAPIVSKFFIKTLPTISVDTYYDYLNEIIQTIYANASTLPTTMDGRKHDHAGLIMKDTLYATLETVNPW